MSESDRPIEVVWDGIVTAVVRKPAGLPTQAPGDADSLERRLRVEWGERSKYLAMVHRLDRPVSGLLLVATTKRAAGLLGQQFSSRKVDKSYLAIVAGEVPAEPCIWTDFIAKRPAEARADVVPEGSGGKRAETRVEVLARDTDRSRTLLRLQPLTGRTHQLRVQAAERGMPILGDTLYGGPEDPPLTSLRIALHAESLAFHDPRSGKRVVVHDPLSLHVAEAGHVLTDVSPWIQVPERSAD